MSLGFKNKTVYVYGLGKSGLSCVEALLNDGARVLCWDENSTSLQQAFSLNGAEVCAPKDVNWQQVAALVKAPGVPYHAAVVAQALQHGVPVMGDMDLLWRRGNGLQGGYIYIGITGTNGKSTTTALVGHVLQQAGLPVAVGGNIGVPVLQLPVLPRGGFYVLEVSSYQLETINELQFNNAALINLSPDHLERHGTMEHYLAVKRRIFGSDNTGSGHVLGVDEPLVQQAAADYPAATTVSVRGQAADISVDNAGNLCENGHVLAHLGTLEVLKGRHNWQNVAVAWALLRPYVSFECFFAGVQTFQALPHRMQKVGDIAGVAFINDSKATNPESAIHALNSYHNIYWLAGGLPKAEGVTPCLQHLHNVRTAFVFGKAEADFAAALQPFVERHSCGTMERALYAAFSRARADNLPQAVVLLSPACASFDQFNSFEHRGEQFAALVHTLAQQVQHKQDVGV